MTPRRQHPIREMIRVAAYDGARALPSDAELDALKLPPAARKAVLEHCREVAAMNDRGTHAAAWVRADELAAGLIDSLPDELADPDEFERRLRPPDTTVGLSPRELAALVPRY